MTEPTIPMLYTDWQKRVYEEHGLLTEKTLKLHKYLESEAFKLLDSEDSRLLELQLSFMLGYVQVLNFRIQRFNRVDLP